MVEEKNKRVYTSADSSSSSVTPQRFCRGEDLCLLPKSRKRLASASLRKSRAQISQESADLYCQHAPCCILWRPRRTSSDAAECSVIAY